MATQTYVDGVTLTAAAEFNKFDTSAYSVLSSVTGTNTLAATGPANYTLSASNPPVWLLPGFTNTSTVTLNITPSGGSSLTAKNVFYKGAACSGGEIQAGIPVGVMYDGTQFNIVANGFPVLTRLTNTLSGNVALSNTGQYFTGPTVAQGTAGTWFASGSVTVGDTSATANINVKLWDGTTVIASGIVNLAAAGATAVVALSGYLSSPAGNIRISAQDSTTTNGLILFNSSANSKDATLSVLRVG